MDNTHKTDVATINTIMEKYAKSIDQADTRLASEFWRTTDESTFIHPKGHERGWEAIKTNFYQNLMGERFSQRKLNIHEVTIHIYGGTAVAEFYWDFEAIFRVDGSPLTTQGRESQVFTRTIQGWKLVHIHYSNMPVTGEREGF